MTPEQTARLRSIFDEACDLEGEARAAFVESACAGDEVLAREVASLLDHHTVGTHFIDGQAISLAARDLARESQSTRPSPDVPGYRILSRIGAGGMGEVFLAEDLTLGRRVALKLLPASFTDDGERLARFKREARAASALNHPCIITVHEIGTSGDTHFIATEFVEGKTLRQKLEAGPVPAPDVLAIGIQVAEALAAAHDAGIIHRDVKPENIMVRPDGYVKVLDFGVAKMTLPESREGGEAALVTLATEPGRLLGTIAYMSPEQLHGDDVDARTDVWSLGVVLYELLTGSRPFPGKSGAAVVSAILERDVPPITVDRHEAPEPLVRIIRTALEKDPARRYASAAAIRDDLRAVRSDLEFLARVRETTGDRQRSALTPGAAGGGPRASRAAWIGATVVVLAAVLGLGAWWIGWRGPESGVDAAIRSIAVLPFVSVGTGDRNEALELGMAETLVTKLSGIAALDVRPVSAARSFASPERDSLAAGRSLGVAAVLDGSIQQSGDRLRVNARLLRVRDGAVLWAEALDEQATDIFRVQDAISERIVSALRLELSDEERTRLVRRATLSSEAYEACLRGRYFLDRRGPDWRRKAVEQFRKAVELDPAYAPAYSGLSDAYAEAAYWGDERPIDAMPKARAAAERALAIDERLAEAHTSLGTVLDDYDWKFADAEREYRRSIELNPKYALAHQRLGMLLCEMGRFEEAESEHRTALALDPLSLNISMSLGAVKYMARDNAGALEQLRRTLELNPDYAEAIGLMAWIHVRDGRPDEAIRLWHGDAALAGAGGAARSTGTDERLQAYARGGIRAYFEYDVEETLRASGPDRPLTVFTAMQLAYLGRKDDAFAVLEQAFRERNSWLGELEVEPGWDPLRSDPRFLDLCRRVGLEPDGRDP